MLEDHLAKNRQMILLSGSRQVGKTTLARAVLPEAVYLNFDITGDAMKIMDGVEKIAEVLALDVPAKRAQAVIFDELLRVRVSGELSHASLGRDLGVSIDTVKNWIGLLESVYFCYSVRPYFRNIANSIRKMPKIYLWDWSLVADRGAQNENFVASHLLKSVDWWTDSGLGRFELGYIRDKQQHEVDFVVTKDEEPLMLVEGKSSLDEPLSSNLKMFAEKLKVKYAFQVAVEAEGSSINQLDYVGRPVRMAFADLAKVLI